MTKQQAQEKITQTKREAFDSICHILDMSDEVLKTRGHTTQIDAIRYKIRSANKTIEKFIDLMDIQTLMEELKG